MINIGIMEDDPHFQETFRDVCSQFSVSHTIIEDIDACGRWASANPGSILVSDLRMGLLNGVDVIEAVHEISPTIELIIFTGYNPEPQEQRRIDAVGARCLMKRDHFMELIEHLQVRSNIPAEQLSEAHATAKIVELEQRNQQTLYILRELTKDLVDDLLAVDDLDAMITSGSESFTVRQLLADIENMTPRGQFHVELWRQLKREMRSKKGN